MFVRIVVVSIILLMVSVIVVWPTTVKTPDVYVFVKWECPKAHNSNGCVEVRNDWHPTFSTYTECVRYVQQQLDLPSTPPTAMGTCALSKEG